MEILSTLNFLPQGIVLLFYGSIFLIFSLYLWLILYWNVGFGYTQCDYHTISVCQRWFPGQNGVTQFSLPTDEIDSVVLELYTLENITNSQRKVYLTTKNGKKIPIISAKTSSHCTELDIDLWIFSQYLQFSMCIFTLDI
jgi:hypothetical protein